MSFDNMVLCLPRRAKRLASLARRSNISLLKVFMMDMAREEIPQSEQDKTGQHFQFLSLPVVWYLTWMNLLQDLVDEVGEVSIVCLPFFLTFLSTDFLRSASPPHL